MDEIFPRGLNQCVLVIKDEHGRILATEPVDKRDEETVKPFLQRMKNLGLSFRVFYTDGCRPYFNAIRAGFGQKVPIQYDYFHIIQNAWRHLWKWFRGKSFFQQNAENICLESCSPTLN